MDSFPNLEPVCCSRCSSNCCFLTCTQISQGAGHMVWYSHLFKNFPDFCEPHKGFGVIHKVELYVFLELFCFIDDPGDASNLNSGSSAAAAATSFQLCPTLCDPIDGSQPGSPIPGILQERILEWVWFRYLF